MVSRPAPISKIARPKWTGGVVQAIEFLLCKHEALSSNSSSIKKKKKKETSKFSIKHLKKNPYTLI
jgi:hypothetical protein